MVIAGGTVERVTDSGMSMGAKKPTLEGQENLIDQRAQMQLLHKLV
jgi:hypothetical protein